jgi:hypothetical protein
MEPEGSLPNSHELSSCSYPEPDHSGPQHPNASFQDPSKYYPPTYVLVFLVVSFPLAFLPLAYTRSSSPHSCYILRPSHLPRLDYTNYTCRRIQITRLLVMQFSPPSRHFSQSHNPIRLRGLSWDRFTSCFFYFFLVYVPL